MTTSPTIDKASLDSERPRPDANGHGAQRPGNQQAGAAASRSRLHVPVDRDRAALVTLVALRRPPRASR